MVPVWNRRNFIAATAFAGIGFSAFPAISLPEDDPPGDLEPLLTDATGNPVTTLTGWIREREIIKTRWFEYLGALKQDVPLQKFRVVKEEYPEGIIRQLIEYESEPGIFVQAYLLKPRNISTPVPGIVAMHSTSDNQMLYIAGLEKGNIVAFGYNLAKQGYVVVCPRCFLWHGRGSHTLEEIVGSFHERHPGSKGMAKMLYDAVQAVDILQTLDIVDKERIGAVGHSLGAKEAFYLGAFDDRVKVVVSNEGGIGIGFSNWDAVWYLGEEIHTFGHQHHEVLSLAAPKPFLLIGGDSADGEISRPYIEAVRPVYQLYGKAPETIDLFNHGTGHSVHPSAEKLTYEWFDKFL